MRKTALLLVPLLLIAAIAAAPRPAAEEAGISVFFSPDGGCLTATVTVINAAKKTLDVQAYLVTTKDLLEPIKAAHGRGVKVRVLMDSDNAVAQYSGATSTVIQNSKQCAAFDLAKLETRADTYDG
jgi:phosphatidylserine/phosphatidylglycerophosphate/cardiolipin synthase-like enzyme